MLSILPHKHCFIRSVTSLVGCGWNEPPAHLKICNMCGVAFSLKQQGGWKATAERNLDIIEMVNRLDAEGRPETADEQKLLAFAEPQD